ncbi:MAG: hypothetical protein ACOCOC_04095 [Prevotella sp.]
MSYTALDILYPMPEAILYEVVVSNQTPDVTTADVKETITVYKNTGGKREEADLSGEALQIDTGYQLLTDNPSTFTISKGDTTVIEILLRNANGDTLAENTITPFVASSVLAQYCPSKASSLVQVTTAKPDETNIHDTFQSGDVWMRTRSSASTSWSDWVRIVGEDGAAGQYVDYKFNLSKNKTTTDIYTSPSVAGDWTDGPQIPTDDYPYLWMRMQDKNLPAGTAVLVGHEYTYVRLTGEDGKTVTAQYSVDGSTNWHSPFATGDIWMRTSEDGGKTWGAAVRIVGEKGDGGAWTDYLFNISSALTTSSPLTAPTPLGRSSWADAPMATTDAYPYLWMMMQKYSDTTTKDGQPTYMRLTGEQGKPGQTGGVGPMMYYAGEWQSGVSYVRTAQVVPLVSHGSDQFFYYPAKEGTLISNEPSSSNTDWKQQQKVPLLLAQLLMVDFGKIASAVFCGDYMMSQRGRHFDTSKNAYVYDDDYKSFDPTTYEQSDDRDWRPLVSIDFKEGLLRVINMIAIGGQFQDVDVEGKLRASLFYSNTKDLTNKKDYTIDPVNEPANCFLYNEPASGHYFVKLPKAADYDGLEISFFMKWKPAENGIPRLHISCVEQTDHLYCRCSATYDAGSTKSRFIPTFDNLNIGYTDFMGTSVTVYWNQFIKFKSLGGSWYAIEGVFTGE